MQGGQQQRLEKAAAAAATGGRPLFKAYRSYGLAAIPAVAVAIGAGMGMFTNPPEFALVAAEHGPLYTSTALCPVQVGAFQSDYSQMDLVTGERRIYRCRSINRVFIAGLSVILFTMTYFLIWIVLIALGQIPLATAQHVVFSPWKEDDEVR